MYIWKVYIFGNILNFKVIAYTKEYYYIRNNYYQGYLSWGHKKSEVWTCDQ